MFQQSWDEVCRYSERLMVIYSYLWGGGERELMGILSKISFFLKVILYLNVYVSSSGLVIHSFGMCGFVTEWPVTDLRHIIIPPSSKLHRFQNTNRHLKIKKLLSFPSTALQAGRSRFRFPMLSLEFFFDTILFGCTVTLRSIQLLTEMSKVYTCTGTKALYRPYGP